MTKKELIEMLAPYSDDVIIYVESEHGQIPEQTISIMLSKDEKLPVKDFDEEIAWKCTDEVNDINAVNAVLLQ